MKALLVVAHGSKLESSNDEVRALVEQLTLSMSDEFAIIDCAFLEFAFPSIPEGIQRCQQQGASSLTVLPYFLSAGKHVRADIPHEAQEACADLHMPLTILPHIGLSQHMVPLLLNAAEAC